jgi:hypothetical protein
MIRLTQAFTGIIHSHFRLISRNNYEAFNSVREMKSSSLNVRMKSTHFLKSDLLYGACGLIDDQNDAKVRQVNS